MIVQWPDMPNVSGNLKVPKPSVYLFGSCDSNGYSFWKVQSARKLDPIVGCVFHSNKILLKRTPNEELSYIKWNLYWLHEADILAFWIDNGQFNLSLFELGLSFGYCCSNVINRLVIGISKDCQQGMINNLKIISEQLGYLDPIHNNFNSWINAIITKSRRYRHEEKI